MVRWEVNETIQCIRAWGKWELSERQRQAASVKEQRLYHACYQVWRYMPEPYKSIIGEFYVQGWSHDQVIQKHKIKKKLYRAYHRHAVYMFDSRLSFMRAKIENDPDYNPLDETAYG